MTTVPSSPGPPPKRDSYFAQTSRPLHCLLFIAPMLLLFQVGTVFYRTSLLAPEDLGRLLGFFGATAPYLPPLVIVAVLLAQHLARRDAWRVSPFVLTGMVGESVAWIVPLVAMNLMTGRLLAQAATHAPASHAFQEVLVAVGAGIYEEFIFRLALISLAMVLMVDLLGLRKEVTAVVAIAFGACLFSLYHFPSGQLGSSTSFPWAELIFRALAGVYLGGIFILRGFAVSVGAHTFYNLYVVWMQLRTTG